MPPLDPDEQLLQRVRAVTRPDGSGRLDGFPVGDEPAGSDGDVQVDRLARIVADLGVRPEPVPVPPPSDLWDRVLAATSVVEAPADGIVGGTATVDGAPCAVLSYDYLVMAGTQGMRGHRKSDRLLELAGRDRKSTRLNSSH